MRHQEMTVAPLKNNERGRPVCLCHWNKSVKLHNRIITFESIETAGVVSTSFDQVLGRRVNNASAVREFHRKVANDSAVRAIKNRDFLCHLQSKIGALYMMVENLNTAVDVLVNGATGHPRHFNHTVSNICFIYNQQ